MKEKLKNYTGNVCDYTNQRTILKQNTKSTSTNFFIILGILIYAVMVQKKPKVTFYINLLSTYLGILSTLNCGILYHVQY